MPETIDQDDEIKPKEEQFTKKSGCVCTCCHKHNFERKNCVIFVRKTTISTTS